MKRISGSAENFARPGRNAASAWRIDLRHAGDFSIKAFMFGSCPSGCSPRAELSLASARWKPEASGCLELTGVSSKQIYATHEPSTFSVTGQTPRLPANRVKITFRKRHLASTDTLTGGGPMSPHQSAARWGPDAIPGPHADRRVRAGTSFPWVTSQILLRSLLLY